MAPGQGPADIDAPHEVNRPRSDGSDPAAKAVFDRDPDHPWNRLHHLLYSRTTREGKTYDQEGLEPPFISTSRFLSEGPSHQRALTLLDEYLSERADDRIKDPVRRAILQRNLWAVFATTVGDATLSVHIDGQSGQISNTDRFVDPGDGSMPASQRLRRRELQERLVQVMRRVALSPAEIEALPDNLAQAVKSGDSRGLSTQTIPERLSCHRTCSPRMGHGSPSATPSTPPRNSWPRRSMFRFTKGRSVFVVFLRLPGGRRATEAYLKELQEGGLPQFPEGTQTALLRRILLIDDSGTLRESPLTEDLQVRVYHKLDLGIPYEFTLHRSDLFAGRAGGLHAIGRDETSYFSSRPAARMSESARASTCGADLANLHSMPFPPRRPGEEFHTVNTIYSRGDHGQKATGLRATEMNHEARTTIRWTPRELHLGSAAGPVGSTAVNETTNRDGR